MKTATELKPAPRIGLALGGGGPLGGIYEIGALRALDEALDGLDFNNIDVYVGVNAGSFVAANLANQMTTAQLCRIFVRNEAEVHPFHPEVFYRPALREIGRRLLAIPGLLSTAVSRFVNNPYDQSLLEAMTILAQAAPAGLFDNEGLHEYLKPLAIRFFSPCFLRPLATYRGSISPYRLVLMVLCSSSRRSRRSVMPYLRSLGSSSSARRSRSRRVI